ncbi:MAG: hypothetical protein GC129_05600 [Proteobacteria bacterium]|nr:hypothetical protein [Pseudomonadota bacterium]
MHSFISFRSVASLTLAALSIPVFCHAASTGQVTIVASVPSTCNITVTPQAGATIANLTLGATNLQVATVNESCNAPAGYTVTMVGTNSTDYTGKFVDSGSSSTRTFTVRYGGNTLNSTLVTDVNSPNTSVDKNVDITYPADTTLTASSGATYAETLNFTITSK